MSRGSEFINDYDENKEDIEKWFSIKSERKYREYAELLREKGLETTWSSITSLYRYDKRLIFNSFRYISFLEEYLRAKVVNSEGNTDETYHKWQGRYLRELKKPILNLVRNGVLSGDCNQINSDFDLVNELRNTVMHAKILISKDYVPMLNALERMLPETYREGFRDNIRSCTKNLNLSDIWLIQTI